MFYWLLHNVLHCQVSDCHTKMVLAPLPGRKLTMCFIVNYINCVHCFIVFNLTVWYSIWFSAFLCSPYLLFIWFAICFFSFFLLNIKSKNTFMNFGCFWISISLFSEKEDIPSWSVFWVSFIKIFWDSGLYYCLFSIKRKNTFTF